MPSCCWRGIEEQADDVDFAKRAEDVVDLWKQIQAMGKGTQYYVPMASR